VKSLAALLVLISLSIPIYASGTNVYLAEIKAYELAVKEADANYKAQEAQNKRQVAAFKSKQNAQTANAISPQLATAWKKYSAYQIVIVGFR
jgi:hypothetical protein